MKKILAVLCCMLFALTATMTGCSTPSSDATTAPTSDVASTASSEAEATTEAGDQPLDKIVLQSKWLPQAQFMGYYVAQEKGYYEDEGIEIEILPGSSDFTAEDQVSSGVANVGVTWYSSLLTYQEAGADLINIGQIFQKSALGLVCKADSGITTGADLKGKTVGNWFGGNEYEIYALLGKYGLDKDKDVTLVQQDFTMDAFLNGEIAAASAMTYNEYGLVLESGVPESDLNFIDMNDEGVAMMEDCLIVSKEWAENNEDLLVRFMRASIKGWQYACENPEEAGKIVWEVGQSVSEDHQIYMAGKVAEAVCPEGFDSAEIGKLDSTALQQTIDEGLQYGLISTDIQLDDSISTKYWDEAVK